MITMVTDTEGKIVRITEQTNQIFSSAGDTSDIPMMEFKLVAEDDASSYNYFEVTADSEIFSVYSLAMVTNNLTIFRYTEDGGLRRLPWFTLATDDMTIRPSGFPIALKKINTDVEITCTYNDPDGFDFKSQFSGVKVKDREYFVDINTTLELGADNTVKFIINSALPGVSTIRAKDDFYLCTVGLIQIRFIP